MNENLRIGNTGAGMAIQHEFNSLKAFKYISTKLLKFKSKMKNSKLTTTKKWSSRNFNDLIIYTYYSFKVNLYLAGWYD